MSEVQFREIPGFPGYRVGDDGSVWSRWRQVGRGIGNGTKSVLGQIWQKMTPGIITSGHLIVTLCPGRHTRLVHRLVLEAFVGPCPKRMQCRHFPDRNPANNALSNLQWGTPAQNQADRLVHGTDDRGKKRPNGKYQKGNTHYHALLTADLVRSIREEYAEPGRKYGKLSRLARKYGVHLSTIHLIVTRKNWKHV